MRRVSSGFLCVTALMAICLPRQGSANGHGPVFGVATPTLGKGGWQLDQAWLMRTGEVPDTEEQTLRTMVSFGVTKDLQISGSFPINLAESIYMPMGRLTASMSPLRELEATLGWRFHKRPIGAARFESTAYVGGSLPLETYRGDGMRATPSVQFAAASGYASRAHYAWLGAGYVRQGERQGDRMGDVAYVTAVYGYRPPVLRVDYPKPDLRFFVEAAFEHTERGQHHGFEMLSSGGKALFVGPSSLLLYKAYGISGGVLFPVYQNTNNAPHERFRVNINFSYFFWLD